MKQLNLLRNNKGFTLVEMIVTLAIFSIVLVVAGNYLFFGNRMYAQSEMKGTEKSIGDNMYAFMQDRLTYATAIEINASQAPKDKTIKYSNVFEIKDNQQHLYFGEKGKPNTIETNTTDLYGEAYYHNYKVGYDVKALTGDTPNIYDRLELKVIVKNKDDTTAYETKSIIKCLNLANRGKSIELKGGVLSVDMQYLSNPIISYDKEQKDDSIFSPIELWDRMNATCEQLIKYQVSKDEKDLPSQWIETWGKANIGKEVALRNATYLSNDNMRTYLKHRYYEGSWPELPPFSEDILNKNPELKKFIDSVRKNDKNKKIY
ncbi:MAG: prepilin-type N-terminal cleavage/methylation domain-containing protein, partial [Eubacterium sp.]